jgi:hypothetical protein
MSIRLHQDPELHLRYKPFLRARSQAWYRNEDWHLEFEDWCEFWPIELWYLRGRGSSDLCLVRRDLRDGWSKTNCVVVTRKTQIQRTNSRKAGHPVKEI